MATKTISITEEAYHILKSWKKGNESFSDVIMKVGRKNHLSDYAGILSNDEGKLLEQNIRLSRSISRKRNKVRL